MRPVRGDYPCKVCGEILHSPGALGGHMSQHRRLGHMDWWEHVTDCVGASRVLEGDMVRKYNDRARAEALAQQANSA